MTETNYHETSGFTFRGFVHLVRDQLCQKTEESSVIRTNRLILREWQDDDLMAFARLNADPQVMHHMPAILSTDESNALAARIQAHFAKHEFGLWAVEIPNVVPFAGFVGLSIPTFAAHFTPCTEVGWRLSRDCWNQGYATEAARAAIAYGFEELQLNEIVSFTVHDNVASQRVMQKLGMTHDPSEDFDHPALAEDHPLRPHVLYRLPKSQWLTRNS